MSEIKYEIIEKLGILSESTKGWTKELNLISWNGSTPKYDIRDRTGGLLIMKKWEKALH